MKKYAIILILALASNLYGATIIQTNKYVFMNPITISNKTSIPVTSGSLGVDSDGSLTYNNMKVISSNGASSYADTAGFATNAGDSETVGGLTAEDLMRVGSQYYFLTNMGTKNKAVPFWG